MNRIAALFAAATFLSACSGGTTDNDNETAGWQSPDAGQLLAVYQAAGDDVAVIDQNGSDYGPMSIFVSGVELTPATEIETMRTNASQPTLVAAGSSDCTAIDDFPMEQFCMLSVSTYEIVPDGMECVESECGESYFEITARLRQTAPGEWVIIGETAAGLFAG